MAEALHEDTAPSKDTAEETSEAQKGQEEASPQPGSEQESEKAPEKAIPENLNYVLDVPEGYEVNHPAMIRVFYRAAQVLSNDTNFVKGDMKPVEKKKTAAETMYPKMAQ
jgi:hypothetical protein